MVLLHAYTLINQQAVHSTDNETEGTSILYEAMNMHKPIPYRAPFWATKYNHSQFQYRSIGAPFQGGYVMITLSRNGPSMNVLEGVDTDGMLPSSVFSPVRTVSTFLCNNADVRSAY